MAGGTGRDEALKNSLPVDAFAPPAHQRRGFPVGCAARPPDPGSEEIVMDDGPSSPALFP